MSAGIYTVTATFPGAWAADRVATGVKPVLLDPRGSVICTPLRVPMDRLVGDLTSVGDFSPLSSWLM